MTSAPRRGYQVCLARTTGCLGADEDVSGRADSRIVDESSHGDVDELAVADDRIEERAARLTMGVIAVLVAIDQKAVPTLGDAQHVALDAAERFEGRTSGSPAVRAMTIHGVEEFIGHGVVD